MEAFNFKEVIDGTAHGGPSFGGKAVRGAVMVLENAATDQHSSEGQERHSAWSRLSQRTDDKEFRTAWL